MKRTKWFDRVFPPIEDNGLLPNIIERLEGTAIRLKHKIQTIDANLTAHQAGKWSIKKEVGHLIDLEPIWFDRMLQIINHEKNLIKADLNNTKTHQTDYDSQNIADIIEIFSEKRQQTIHLLRNIKPEDLEKFAVHPRLGTAMKIIDLAFFVAEHDDHHLAQITFLSHQK